MQNLKIFLGVVLLIFVMSALNIIVSADEIMELQFNYIVVDMGYKDEQNVYSADLSDYITTVPSGLSLTELDFYVEDYSIADFIENDYLGTVTIIGENYGTTNLYVSNDNFHEIIPIYVVYPRSGSEPDYDPFSWNLDEEILFNSNCYSYILDLLDPVEGLENAQFDLNMSPGKIYNCLNNKNIDTDIDCNDYELKNFIELAKMDLLSLNNSLDYNKTFKCLDLNNYYREPLEEALGIVDPNKFNFACDPGTYKVVLGRDEDGWMHWIRQDSNGLWSHKRGNKEVTNLGNGLQVMISPFILAGEAIVPGYLYIGCFQVPAWR